MRKLVWFIIGLLLIVGSVAVACAKSPSINETVSNGLTGIGGAVWVSLSTGWSNLASTVGASGTYFLIYTCVVGLFFIGIFLLLTRSRVASKLPLTKKQVPASDVGYQKTPSQQPVVIPKKSTSTVEPQPVATVEAETEGEPAT